MARTVSPQVRGPVFIVTAMGVNVLIAMYKARAAPLPQLPEF